MDLKIVVIVGSVRPNRVGLKVAEWFMGQIPKQNRASFDLIDLAEEGLPFLNEPDLPAMGNYQQPSTKKWASKITQYDGFILVTPEYNHGYSPVLKNALDTLYAEWQKKPVAFVGYGSLGASRSIEQLVQVTAQLNMVPIPSSAINVIDLWEAFDDKGNLKPEKVRGNPDKLITNLLWWADVLKTAK